MHLIALVESVDHVCCRYRLRAFLPALTSAGHTVELLPIPRDLRSRWRLPSKLRHADGVILLRKLLSAWEIRRIRKATPRFIFDIDDAVWLRDSYSPKGLHDPKRLRRFTAIVKCADLVVCGNSFLQKQAHSLGAKETLVIPTCVEPKDYPLAEHPQGPSTLVWVGSSATLKGLEQERNLWEKIGGAIPDLRLKLVCDRFLKLDSMPVIEARWSEASEKTDIASSSIGIGWIPDDDWSRGKCGLKVLQYLAAGLPVVTNSVGVHPEMVIPNQTGFLANTPDEWIDAIRELSEKPELRRTLGSNGRKLVEERYSVEKGAELWNGALRGLAKISKPIEWHFAPNVTPFELNLDVEKEAGRVTVIKHGKHRTVYKVMLANGQTVYWKHCRLNGPRAWWREILRGPKARLEFDKALELHKRGIQTIEPLAWGKFPGRYPKGSFLITKELEEAIPLDVYLERPLSVQERFAVNKSLAEFFAKLHREGITHPDPHPGNLLIKTDGTYSLFPIDLHDLEIRKSLHPGYQFQNLVLLNRWFALRATRSDRRHFWKHYLNAVGPTELTRDNIRMIESITAESNFDLWEKRNLRTLGSNRSFQKVRRGDLRGHMIRGLPTEVLEPLLQNPDAFFETGKLLKNSRSSAVAEISFTINGVTQTFIWKKFKLTHWYDTWTNLVRYSPVMRAWRNGHSLAERQFPTPTPYLVLQRYSGNRPGEGYILCEKIPDALPLNEWWTKTNELDARRTLLFQLGILIRQMHERGFLHRDLKAPNILVTKTGQLVILDVVGAQRRYPLSNADRLKDVGRLATSALMLKVSATDKLRFVWMYTGWGLYGKGGWKEWWAEVVQWVRFKIEKNKEKGRPLS